MLIPDHPPFDPTRCTDAHLLLRALPIPDHGPALTLDRALQHVSEAHPHLQARFTLSTALRLTWAALERHGWARWESGAPTQSGGYRITPEGEVRLTTLWRLEVIDPALAEIDRAHGHNAMLAAALRWADAP